MLGAGDAFSAGFLSGWVRGEDYDACAATPTPAARSSCRATAARRRCRRASSSIISSPTPRRIPRPDQDATLTRLHRVTAPRAPRDEVFAFAFDHRNQFFELAQRGGRRRSAHAGAQEAASSTRSRETEAALAPRRSDRHAVRRSLRPGCAQRRDRPRLVDRPAGRAAGLESAACSIAAARSARRSSRGRAEHVVKCLVQFHPDDDVGNRLEQEAQIRALYDAVQASGHELLLEIIPPKRAAARRRHRAPRDQAPIQPRHLSRVVEARADGAASGRRVDALIAERDPYCRGVLLLGLDAERRHARARASATRARAATCRGFAVGRTIFHEPGRAWLAGDDRRRGADARACARNFEALIDAWRDVRASRSAEESSAWRERTIRLTMAQALVRYLAALRADARAAMQPLFGGVFAIFGHGNVAGIGEALYRHRDGAADLSRAQRAGDGARGDRLRQGAISAGA